jgi:hypothetical protein
VARVIWTIFKPGVQSTTGKVTEGAEEGACPYGCLLLAYEGADKEWQCQLVHAIHVAGMHSCIALIICAANVFFPTG